MKKILLSMFSMSVVVAVAVFATQAYFSDTEKSSGNMFVVGKLNLKIDNTCHYNELECKLSDDQKYHWDGDVQKEECFCTWSLKDLTDEAFFNFLDVKPGDHGEDTISLHVDDNDAWVCAKVENLANNDNGCEKPESDVDTSCGANEGELSNNLLFTVWKDVNCNNFLDAGETLLVKDKPAEEGYWPIADSNIGTPLKGKTDYCLGVSWNIPSSVGNIIQTDSLVGDIKFTAVQSRNNPEYLCVEGRGCTPQEEVCDGVDNNCNSQIDEGEVCVVCGDGIIGGSEGCDDNNTADADGCSASCTVEPGYNCSGEPSVCTRQVTEEVCGDGIDNNGDGKVDEGCEPWINELHYDNTGDDVNEGVEIAGKAGINLSGYSLVFYNGGTGEIYTSSATLNLSGTIPNQLSGFGTLWFDKSGIQNGAPDGLALIGPGNIVIKFLSYEGSFTATNGVASGLNSIDIGVDEEPAPAINQSLQLQGTGNKFSDFTWSGPIENTRGSANTGQTFN